MKNNFEFVNHLLDLHSFQSLFDLESESKHTQLITDYEQLKNMKNEWEMTESQNRKKSDEMNRSRQAVLDRTRDEYEKLLQKYHDLDEVYREVVTVREKDSCKSRSSISRQIYS